MDKSSFERLMRANPNVYQREGMQLSPKFMGDQERYAEITGGIGEDYDYGQLTGRDGRGHGTDAGKLPWHPTFSDQSAFTSMVQPGGTWWRAGGGDTFTPTQRMVDGVGSFFSPEYMRRQEPNVKVKKPKK